MKIRSLNFYVKAEAERNVKEGERERDLQKHFCYTCKENTEIWKEQKKRLCFMKKISQAWPRFEREQIKKEKNECL